MSAEQGCFHYFRVVRRSDMQMVFLDLPGSKPIIMPARATAVCCGPQAKLGECSLRYVSPGFRGYCRKLGMTTQFSAPYLEVYLQEKAKGMGCELSFD